MVTPISTRLCFVEGSLRSQIMSSKYDTRLYKPDEQDRSSIFSHCVPWNPGAQLQLYPLTPSLQVALFLQGWLSQVTFWEYKITSIIFVNTILLIVLSNVNVKRIYRNCGPLHERRGANLTPLTRSHFSVTPCTKRFVIGYFSTNVKLRSADLLT